MKRFFCIALVIFGFESLTLLSQSVSDLKKSFYYAESRILFEDYKEALPQYLTLLKKYPSNANILYRTGQCYLNIPGEKDKAIKYLEDAVNNINPRYAEGKFTENGAPYDALYLLANAYRINNQIDKAVSTYKKFQANMDYRIYDSAVVNLQLKSCLNAQDLMHRPLFMKKTNLGLPINQKEGEFDPVISDDGNLMVFSRSLAFYDAMLFSVKRDGKWSDPVNMNEILKVDKDYYPTSISHDGKELYVYSSADLDGTLYVTRFENGTWTPLARLNDNINTKYWESHATISHDNQKLYFTSNRKGGFGGLDIYVSRREANGSWGPAVNLGPVVNTPYNEESPFLTEDDKTLFFSSRGHFNMGGYDIFYSTMQPNGSWSIPLNVGYPLNTTDDDLFFKPVKDGNEGYIAMYNDENANNQDIYQIIISSGEHPRKFYISGTARIGGLQPGLRDSVRIIAQNTLKPGEKYTVYSDGETGKYSFEVPDGNYKLTFDADGGEKTVKNLDLPRKYPSDSIMLPGTVLPKSDNSADLSINGSNNIKVTKGDPVDVPLRVEPRSELIVEHWAGDKLVSSESISIVDSTYTYRMVPEIGENRVSFKLTDRFNNMATADLFINREKIFSEIPFRDLGAKGEMNRNDLEKFMEILKNRADQQMLGVINSADTTSRKFRNPDDLLALLRDVARNKNLNPEEVDKLALEVAVKDNILTQAAVDLLASYSSGKLRDILTGLDIYKEGLKTWDDLLNYISVHSAGEIKPGDLNSLADTILNGSDQGINILKEKILDFSQAHKQGNLLREAVNAADQSGLKTREKWLKSFYNEALSLGLTSGQLSQILAALAASSGTDTDQFLRSMIIQSGEPLASSLRSVVPGNDNINTPARLIDYLLTNTDKEKFPEEEVYKSIANMIINNAMPVSDGQSGKGFLSGRTLIAGGSIIGIGLIILLILFFIRKKKRGENA